MLIFAVGLAALVVVGGAAAVALGRSGRRRKQDDVEKNHTNLSQLERAIEMMEKSEKGIAFSDSELAEEREISAAEVLFATRGGFTRRFGPFSTIAFGLRHPEFITCAVLRHPWKVFRFLTNLAVKPLEQFMELLPGDVLAEVTGLLLDRVPGDALCATVAPIMNSPSLHPAAAALLNSGAFGPERVCQVLNEDVPLTSVISLLTAPPEKLAKVVQSLHADRFEAAMLPFVKTSETLIRSKVVPLLTRAERPEHIALLLNHVDPPVLFPIIRLTPVSIIASLLDTLEESELGPQGTLVQLLQTCDKDPYFLDDILVPLINRGGVEKAVWLLRNVPADRILFVLTEADPASIIALCEHADTEIIGRFLNSFLVAEEREQALNILVSGLGGMTRSSPLGAALVEKSSRGLNFGIKQASRIHSAAIDPRCGEESCGCGFSKAVRADAKDATVVPVA